MTSHEVVKLKNRLPWLADVLRAMVTTPDFFVLLDELAMTASEAIASPHALMRVPALLTRFPKTRLPGFHQTPECFTGPEKTSALSQLADGCREWLSLEPLFAEFQRRLQAGKRLDGRVLQALVSVVDDLAGIGSSSPIAIYSLSRAQWGDGEVHLPELDLTFHSPKLVRFFSSAPCRYEDDEFGEADSSRVAVIPPERVLVFAATIGAELERAAGSNMVEGSPFAALAVDALGSTLAEGAARDFIELMTSRKLPEPVPPGGRLRRFHVGYGDWQLEEQKQLFAALDPGEIGISLSSSCLMTPEKSVAGIAGVKRT